MGQFYIKIDNIENEIENMRKHGESLNNQKTTLLNVCKVLSVGTSTDAVKRDLNKLGEMLGIEQEKMLAFATALEDIKNAYKNCESDICNHLAGIPSEASGNTGKESAGEETGVDNPDDGPFNVYEWLAEQTGIPQEVLEVIAFILSFIPVINCVTDIIDIVNDVNLAMEDGQWDIDEIGMVALDVVSLIGDALIIGQIFKAIKGGVKTVKTASTAAKTAEKATKKIEKEMAENVVKNAPDLIEVHKQSTNALKRYTKTTKEVVTHKTRDEIKKLVKEGVKENIKDYTKTNIREDGRMLDKLHDIATNGMPGIVQDGIKEHYWENVHDDLHPAPSNPVPNPA